MLAMNILAILIVCYKVSDYEIKDLFKYLKRKKL